MSLEVSLREISAGLIAVRATERKKSAESLKDFLSRNAVPSLLSENSLKRKGYNWNNLFDDINEYVLKETEKYETSKTFETATVPLCSSLLHMCVSGSNKGKAYIKCDQITEASLFILKDKRLAKAVGDIYLNLLNKHVLPHDYYAKFITPHTWEDLLDVCLTSCCTNNSSIDDFTKLRLLLLVIKKGSSYCQFVIPLRDALSRILKCFDKVAGDKKVREVVIDITTILLQILSVECRLSMCEFTERNLPSILKFYDQNLDTKKKTSLFRLLNLIVKLHHPEGRLQNEEGSLASNWDMWNRYLNSIMEIICLEATSLQKNRKQNDDIWKQCSQLYELAAAVYFQIFNILSTSENNEPGASSKRARVSINRHRVFGDIVEEMRNQYLPWLGVVYIYAKNHGLFITLTNYISIISVIENIITGGHNVNWNILEDMTCLVLDKAHTISDHDEFNKSVISLWNSVVRQSTQVNSAHKCLQTIIKNILKLNLLEYHHVQPLTKLYFEKAMPVTQYSLKTLNCIFNKFFRKCSSVADRTNCFNWLVQGKVFSIAINDLKEFLLKVISDENIHFNGCKPESGENTSLYDVLYESLEKCMLFSEFEIEIPIARPFETPRKDEIAEINPEVNKQVEEYFHDILIEYSEKILNKNVDMVEYIKFIHSAIAYVDLNLHYNSMNVDIANMELFQVIRNALRQFFVSITDNLKSDKLVADQKTRILKCIQEIFMGEFESRLFTEVRSSVNEDFFHCINNVMNLESPLENEETMYEDDGLDIDPNSLKHGCITVLAAYCRKPTNFREEVLELIVDPKLYDFACHWDVECAFRTIEILSESTVEERSLDSIFSLLQKLCKDLFRNSEATYRILRILSPMLDYIFEHDESMRQNCFIMVNSYLQRCEKMFYPPHVAAIIYDCVEKIAILNQKQNREVESSFKEALEEKIKGNVHSMRLYCCYLLKRLTADISGVDVEVYMSGLLDIFLINVSEANKTILRDESVNRTLTLLHSFNALAQTKPYLLRDVVLTVLQVQKDKNLDRVLVRKVLNMITRNIAKKNISEFMNENILSVLSVWFTKGNAIEDLPLNLFGFDSLDVFLAKHAKWLICADILWRKNGSVTDGDVLKLYMRKAGKSLEYVIEQCFCNITVLCLPFIVSEKYKLYHMQSDKTLTNNATKMFYSTRQVLGTEKWSNLFAENVGELVLMVAKCLCDHAEASEMFGMTVPDQSKLYNYPKIVFTRIFQYFGELIDEDIMQHLCDNQALIIFKILIKLWENVINQHIIEFKVLCLHVYVTYVESIPLDQPTDAFVCNFVCNSIAHVIQQSENKQELKALVKAMSKVLHRFLPNNADLLRKSATQLISILIIKKEEGFQNECNSLLVYLTVDMKDCLKDSEDVVDFLNSLSQGTVDNTHCSTEQQFKEKLKSYKANLVCPSHETLLNLRHLLKANKHYVDSLYAELNAKGFSEECGSSIVHQVIYALSNILKTVTDEKTCIEACNCLAVIGNYDLKTLVTVPPSDTNKVINIEPKQYFAIVVISTLSEMLFDENPGITNKVVKILNQFLEYRDGKIALDVLEVDKQLLTPFLPSNSKSFAEFTIDKTKFKDFIKQSWVPSENKRHSEWIIRITCSLLDVFVSPANYLSPLKVICELKPSLCQKLLPALMGLFLESASESEIQPLSQRINQFFQSIWESSYDDRCENSGDSIISKKSTNALDHDHKMIVQYVLDVVNFVRLQRTHYRTRHAMESLNYLKLEYDKVAWAATVAAQNLAAIFYGELFIVARNNGVPTSSPEATGILEGGENMQRIFRKCYVSIGEMDAIDGCGTAHLTSEDEKRKHLINTGQFTDALLLHDIALSGGQIDPELQYGVVRSLHKSGMHHLALQYIKSLPETDELNDVKYECLSFLGDWSNFVDIGDLVEKSKQTNCNHDSILKAFRYSCLKDCLNIQHSTPLDIKMSVPLNKAKLAIARLCQNLNMEKCQSVYSVVGKLHLFSDIEDYVSVRSEKMTINELLDQWKVEKLPLFHDFKHLEALITQRSLILENAARTNFTFLKDIASLQLQYAELGLPHQRIQLSQRLLATAKKLQSSNEVSLLESQISWAKGHKDIALSLLRNVVTDEDTDTKLNAVAIRQYGLWMAESKCENAREIIDKYLKKCLNQTNHVQTRLKVYYDIARFADAEYKQVVSYMNSSIFENKVKCVESLRGTASSLRSTQQSLTRDERKALITNERFKELDEAEITNTRAEKESFLHLAMRYYLLSLKQCEENNLSVFRVISLWLDNQHIALTDTEDHSKESFKELLHAIPSRKFVMVLPQLAPRLSLDDTPFADHLRKIIKRCAIEHPHHTLPILFSLKNSDKDKCILNASQKVGGGGKRSGSQEPRVMAAETMVQQLATDQRLTRIVKQMEKLCDATISLANYVPKSKESKQKIPSAEPINSLGGLDAVPIPTLNIPLSHECNYTYLTSLSSFEKYFELVGGINCPKKITCRSSDGTNRILLIKGEDDLRQDAVMQQVFNIVNTLLEKNSVTSRNKLLIRTYKVVPLSKRSGVLEWCEGTIPLGSYLSGNAGAHTRYRPRDITPSAARAKLNACHEQRKSNKDKLKVFLSILREFKPVFHYFFTEHYLDPVTWYERKLAYTKSVATSSMVGYIMGLGDRHVQNILIDKNTAEVIHIDFGIAFDQGKALLTPETIPFRLTQDMIAGFGSSGVEGIFRRCCERTMQLLRDNQETLLTILEVLLCDPLYSWTVTSQQNTLARVNCPTGSNSSIAERSLMTVSSKLNGIEGGVAGGVAVAGQVATLLRAATDPANLSRLFPGWQPYL